MVWISCCLLREGLRVEGPGSVETTAGEEWVGTAERHKSIPKTTCVKANRTLNAVSDGTFANASRPCAFCLGSCYSHMHGVLHFQPMPPLKRAASVSSDAVRHLP